MTELVRAKLLEGSRKPRRRFAQAILKVRASLSEGSRSGGLSYAIYGKKGFPRKA